MPSVAGAEQWEMVAAIVKITSDDEVVGGGALTGRRKSDKHRAALAACDRGSHVARRFVPIDLKSRRRSGRHLGLESEARDRYGNFACPHPGLRTSRRIHEAYQMLYAGCTDLHSAEIYLRGCDS